MTKKFILPLLLTLVLPSCGQSKIFVPDKVFENDDYNRIGVRKTKESSATLNNENKIKVRLLLSSQYEIDRHVTEVVLHNEIRDLSYAYFGSSVPTNFKNYRLSENSTSNKFVNNAQTIMADSYSEQETSLGSVKNKLQTVTYTFDTNIEDKTSTERNYETRIVSAANDEKETVTSVKKGSYTTTEGSLISTFGLTPIKEILHSFPENEDENERFDLFDEDAVYNQYTDSQSNFAIVSDAISLFFNYKTSNGREYKAVENHFYESHIIYEGVDSPRITYFRKYNETLILSDDVVVDTPVIYLEKPALIKYQETTYEIKYDQKNSLKYESIPEVS